MGDISLSHHGLTANTKSRSNDLHDLGVPSSIGNLQMKEQRSNPIGSMCLVDLLVIVLISCRINMDSDIQT
jgi:hypothetical protein